MTSLGTVQLGTSGLGGSGGSTQQPARRLLASLQPTRTMSRLPVLTARTASLTRTVRRVLTNV